MYLYTRILHFHFLQFLFFLNNEYLFFFSTPFEGKYLSYPHIPQILKWIFLLVCSVAIGLVSFKPFKFDHRNTVDT
jgi:hypothetical protein